MPKFIVCHGSVSGKKIGESITLTQEAADHINSSGKMLRAEDEEPAPKKRVDTGLRTDLKGKEKTVKLDGTVVSTEADEESAQLEEPAPEETEEKPVKKGKKKPAPKKGV